MQLLLLHYNNYFNRIIKKKDTIADYKAADADYKEVSNIPKCSPFSFNLFTRVVLPTPDSPSIKNISILSSLCDNF